MRDNNKDRWVLFQIFDCVLERWSPVYCATSIPSMDLECKEMAVKLKNRVFEVYALGEMCDGDFKPFSDLKIPVVYNKVEEVLDEISAAQ